MIVAAEAVRQPKPGKVDAVLVAHLYLDAALWMPP
jgi:hypothetical protein